MAPNPTPSIHERILNYKVGGREGGSQPHKQTPPFSAPAAASPLPEASQEMWVS